MAFADVCDDLLGNIDPRLLVGGLTVAFGLTVYAVLAQLEEKAALRSSLRQLDEYEVESVRDQELLAPVTERVLGPIVEAIGKIGGRFNPPDYVEQIRKRHVQAGINSPDKVERFLALRLLGFVFVPIWLGIMFLWNPMELTGMLKWGAVGLGVMIGTLGPTSQLTKKVEARQSSIQRALPDVLDLLVISVEAGLGFDAALSRVANAGDGVLAEELRRTLNEITVGMTRTEALRHLGERTDVPELRHFVLTLSQAEQYGLPIARVLRIQSGELRVKRRQRAEEEAMKIPVKIVFPLVFCIFPALFVIVLGPAMINISRAF